MKKLLFILYPVFNLAFTNNIYTMKAPLFLQGNSMMTCIDFEKAEPFFLRKNTTNQKLMKLTEEQKKFLMNYDIQPLSALSIGGIFEASLTMITEQADDSQADYSMDFLDKSKNKVFSLKITPTGESNLQKSSRVFLCFLREEVPTGTYRALKVTSAKLAVQENNKIVAKENDGLTTVMINGKPAETTVSFSMISQDEIEKVFSSPEFIKVVEDLRTNKPTNTTAAEAPSLLSFYQKLWEVNDLTKPSTNQ